MKELKYMTKKERTLISIQCDRFFLTVNKYKDATVVFNILKESLKLEDRYDKELWCFMTCVGKSLRAGNNGSQFPLKNAHYIKANSLHQIGLNAQRAFHVIGLLDKEGWIEHYKGYSDLKNKNNYMRGCIIFSKKLKGLYTVSLISRYARPVTPAEMIVVKDSKTKEPFMKLTKFKGVGSHRSFMKDYNGMLNRTTIALCGINCAVSYKQVFSDNLDNAGRFYSFGGFQTAHAELRSMITLNGNITTEVDVKGIHPAICRLVQGCPCVDESFDPYGTTLNLNIPVSEARLLCKKAMMCMINCKTKRGASIALENIWKEDISEKVNDKALPSLTYFDAKVAKDVIEALEKHNSPVKFFGKDQTTWGQLQRLDSRVCEGVMRKLLQDDIAVLVYHDSWLVEAEYREILKGYIFDSWYEVFSTRDNCFLTIDF